MRDTSAAAFAEARSLDPSAATFDAPRPLDPAATPPLLPSLDISAATFDVPRSLDPGATPLLLPSPRMYLLSLIGGLLFVIRTIFEDRTLRAELDGYTKYATRVRFRLIPGVW